MNNLSDLTFVECEPCTKKLGSPVLCESCLHNRQVISRLIGNAERRDKDFEEVLDRLDLVGWILSIVVVFAAAVLLMLLVS